MEQTNRHSEPAAEYAAIDHVEHAARSLLDAQRARLVHHERERGVTLLNIARGLRMSKTSAHRLAHMDPTTLPAPQTPALAALAAALDAAVAEQTRGHPQRSDDAQETC